jgi:20S proteasome subunit alpha 5
VTLDVGDEEGSMSRPFGVALLIAGHDDDDGYQLYHTDPSGTVVKYQAKVARCRLKLFFASTE